MTNAFQIPARVPSVAAGLIHDMAQKALTSAAASLTLKGVMDRNDAPAFVECGLGVVMFALSIGWTLLANEIRQSRYQALLNAPPPSPPQQ